MSDISMPNIDLSNIPIARNPDGSSPNFIDPPNNENLVLGVGTPLVTIALLFVILRICTNLKTVGRLLLDDYFCILAFVFLVPYFGLSVSLRNIARHPWDIPLSSINASTIQRLFAYGVISGPTFWSSKAAIPALYLRVFAPEQWLRWSCYGILVFTFVTYWSIVPLAFVWCVPRTGEHWDLGLGERCSQLSTIGPVQGAVSTMTDILIILLPLPIVSRLNLNPRRKAGLMAVFLVGILALLTSIISEYYRVEVYLSTDKFWDSPVIYSLATAECAITIIVSCAPATASFWKHHFVKSKLYSKLRSTFSLGNGSRVSTSRQAVFFFEEKGPNRGRWGITKSTTVHVKHIVKPAMDVEWQTAPISKLSSGGDQSRIPGSHAHWYR